MPDFEPEASSEAAAPSLTEEEAIANLRGTDLSERDLTPSGLALIAHAARSARSTSLPV